ncbi:MAG: MGMT family protein [Candidatus Gracilibacteria bacterium]|nr:MGMT family protein [Candidatus Gracilibacteria bacterium]
MKQEIFNYLLTIPKGKVTTYKNIAKIFGVHPRMVSQTMRYNKNPEFFSCYKVIASTGKISGYNTIRGVEEKIEKLEKDGIEIINGVIDKKFII